MQIAVAIALAVFYVSVTLAWGGLPPRGDAPWWVLAPFIVTFGAGVLNWLVSSVLPVPWAGRPRYGMPPRRVHLSWRTAFHVPGYLPMLVLLYYIHWSVSLHFDIGWMVWVVVALAAPAAAFVARGRRREFLLLRDGEMAMAVVDARSDIGEGPDRIAYHFTTAGGLTVARRGWDLGHGVARGSSVPVFYESADPGNHVIACSCWFQAD